MTGTPRQTFRIDEFQWKEFQKKCEAKGYTASDVLRAFIMEVIKGNMSVDTVKPAKNSRGVSLAMTEDAILNWLKKNDKSE